MSVSGFVWKQENFYIRQNKTWNMDKYKVVIVDDDEVSLENLSFELRKDARFSLEGTARNGRKGKKLITKVQPDLLFLDVEMPDMTGLDLLQEMRDNVAWNMRVVFYTAYDKYMIQAIREAAFDYLLKPFEDGELESAILRAKERIETDRGKQRDTGLSRSVPDKAPVKEQYPGALEGDGPEINAAVIRLCLPFDENTAGLTGYVRDAVLYMASHYGESAINVAKIAGAVGISEGHLSHCFKKETGYTVMGWLTRYRMKKAVELLSDHRNKVYEVAEKVGYKDIAYFSNTFKKIAGVAPSEIQEK